MNTPIGRQAERSNDRLEAELSAWLRSLEPVGTPVALRVRTFADLRAEVERPRPRFGRLVPALSATAMFGVIVIVLGLLAALAIGLAAPPSAGGLSSIVPPGALTPPQAQGGQPFDDDPAGLAVPVLAACLGGLAVLARPVRAAATWLAFGKTPVPPAPPLPFRRPWRTIPRLTWVVLGLTMLTLWTVASYGPLGGAPTLPTADPLELGVTISYWAEFPLTFLALAVAWRYPRRDRSGRLLLLGATLALGAELYGIVNYSLLSGSVISTPEILQVLEFLGPLSLACMVAGVAGRSGAVRRPPAWLAALSVGVAFGLTMYMTFEGIFDVSLVPWVTYFALGGIQTSLVAVAWLAMVWVSLIALRRHRSWPWALVLIAGLSCLCAMSLHGMLVAIVWTAPPFREQAFWIDVEHIGFLARETISGLACVAFLAALLSGLRPALEPARPSNQPAEEA
jgi:hypothetical protein